MVFLKKKEAPALTHISNDSPSAFPQNNLYNSVHSMFYAYFPFCLMKHLKRYLIKLLILIFHKNMTVTLQCHDLDL